MIIAIDGPAASGKSTVARGIARKLKFDYLDTGAMYRALTWKVIHERIDLSDEKRITAVTKTSNIEFEKNGDIDRKRIFVDGKEISKEIRVPKVNAGVSIVSKIPGVRNFLVKKQRDFAGNRNVVVEGRDIGSVVFPQAQVKIYLTATPKERACRRHKELQQIGHSINLLALEREILSRDRIDSSRGSSPLLKAPDARMIDTTGRKVEDVVNEIISTYVKR